jgi:beta-phosphoglucomutase family hydrolase
VTRERFDAVLFDLDGVLTDTASLHARCWKQVFDAFLAARAKARGERFVPFDADHDYRLYVDGKPRLDGVRDFFAARGIALPEGGDDDPPDAETVHAVAARKDALISRALAGGEVPVYDGSVRWLDALRAAGLRTAVVSSSHHCAEVLAAVGIADRFAVRVDGHVIDANHLAGKPAPDAFLEAARALAVAPARAVVVEDALAGVQAGRAGGFGLVVGVARHGDEEALAAAGADRVVRDLAEMLS